jgi:ketosteroid isomerase-like protein
MAGHDDFEQIRKLLAEYGRLLDARDPHGWAALFGEDGEWVGGTRYGAISGPDALARFVSDEFGATPPSVHIFGNMAIEVDGDTATAWSRWMLLEEDGAGGVRIVLAGHYDDRLRRTRDGWRFARREVHVDLPQGV